MDSGNGVLTTRLSANGQKNEANGHVMDSEWTANGQRMDNVYIVISAPFPFILGAFSLYFGIVLAHDRTFGITSYLCASDK